MALSQEEIGRERVVIGGCAWCEPGDIWLL